MSYLSRVCALAMLTASATTHGDIFVVNSTSNTTDGACETAPGNCTLRDAIAMANGGGGHTVSFADLTGTGPWTIAASIALTADNIIVDGTTAPGWNGTPLVQLRPTSPSADTVRITSNGNVIRGLILSRFFFGVEILGNDNHIAASWIGVDVTGAANEGGNTGVIISGGSRNVVGVNGDGVDDEFEGNVIAERVIVASEGQIAAENNVVAGNVIGTSAAGLDGPDRGSIVLWNALPGSLGTRIGTDGDGVSDELEGNVIGAAGRHGIRVPAAAASGLVIAGNRVGIDAGNCPLSNATGIDIEGGGDAPVTIGGELPAQWNIIAYSDGPGIRASGESDVLIAGNSLFRNSGLAIDLGPSGPTDNDPGDGDQGPNGLQNWPVLDSVTVGGTTRITGSLDSLPSTEFALRFFASSMCGRVTQAEIYLGGDIVTTNDQGLTTFDIDVAAVDSERFPFITATATHPERGTSELSNCVTPANDVLFRDPFESIEFRCRLP